MIIEFKQSRWDNRSYIREKMKDLLYFSGFNQGDIIYYRFHEHDKEPGRYCTTGRSEGFMWEIGLRFFEPARINYIDITNLFKQRFERQI